MKDYTYVRRQKVVARQKSRGWINRVAVSRSKCLLRNTEPSNLLSLWYGHSNLGWNHCNNVSRYGSCLIVIWNENQNWREKKKKEIAHLSRWMNTNLEQRSFGSERISLFHFPNLTETVLFVSSSVLTNRLRFKADHRASDPLARRRSRSLLNLKIESWYYNR